jgi:hypothetical protein
MRSSALLLMALAGAPVQATTLGDLAKALAHREANTYNDWDALQAIEGVRWRDLEMPGASFAREGTVTLAELGPATVLIAGARQMMFDAEVSVASTIAAKDLPRALKAQFPADTRVELVRDRCAGKPSADVARVYRVTLKSRQPLFVGVVSASSATTDRPGTVFAFAREIKEHWAC